MGKPLLFNAVYTVWRFHILCIGRRKILINRGWIPLAYRKQASRLKGLVTGPQKIRALVRSYNKVIGSR